jgi:hypothetical protein
LYQISGRMCLIFGNPHLAFGGKHTILEGTLNQIITVNGTRLLDRHIPDINLEAKAGYSILVQQMNYFVSLSKNHQQHYEQEKCIIKSGQKEDVVRETDCFMDLSVPFHSSNSSGFVSLKNFLV